MKKYFIFLLLFFNFEVRAKALPEVEKIIPDAIIVGFGSYNPYDDKLECWKENGEFKEGSCSISSIAPCSLEAGFKNDFSDNWNKKTPQGFSFSQDGKKIIASGYKDFGFLKIDNVTLLEDKKDLSIFFQLKNKELFLNESHHEQFFSMIKKMTNFRLGIKGQCAQFNNIKTHLSYDLFQSMEGKSIGVLKVHETGGGVSILFTPIGASTSQEFATSISYKKLCPDIYNFVHQAKEAKGEWVNLGKGPWGNDGWIKAKYYHLLEDSPFDFELKGDGWVNYRRSADGKVYAEGSTNFLDEKGDLQNKKIKETVMYEDLYNENGELVIKLNCSWGC